MTEAQLNQLRAQYKLAATATVEEILAAATKAGTDLATLTAENAKLKSDAPKSVLTAADIAAAVEPLKAENAALKADVAAQKKARLDAEVDAAADKAKRNDGKMGRAIIASHIDLAKKLAASEGIKAATDFLESIPASVPMQGAGAPMPTGETGKMTAAAAQAELDALVTTKMKAGMSLRDASRAANKERRDLADLAFAVSPTHAATAEN